MEKQSHLKKAFPRGKPLQVRYFFFALGAFVMAAYAAAAAAFLPSRRSGGETDAKSETKIITTTMTLAM